MGTIDHVMIRTMALKAGCYQDIHRLLILGNILRPPVTVVDLRRQSELRRHPGSDHPACLRSGRRASARGQSWFRLPSSCQNLTNTTGVVGTAIHAPRSVVYTAVLTDVGNVDSDNRQSKHCEQRDKSVCGVQHRLYCTCTWERLYCWSLKKRLQKFLHRWNRACMVLLNCCWLLHEEVIVFIVCDFCMFIIAATLMSDAV